MGVNHGGTAASTERVAANATIKMAADLTGNNALTQRELRVDVP
jgi:hypothetical protein